MSQNTKELMLEVLSEESSLSNEFGVGSKERFGSDKKTNDSPSPFKGEGWGEGKDICKQAGVIVGQLKTINDHGEPFVEFIDKESFDLVQARSTVHLGKADLGQDVVLMFERGDLRKPIIIGFLCSLTPPPHKSAKYEEPDPIEPIQVDVDGERLTFTAKKEIVLKCGKASITLTKAGKILIKGEYLLNRASGVNRIQGGSVQIN